MKLLAVVLLVATVPAVASKKPKIEPTPYADGTLIATKDVPTGDFTCTQYGNTSNCTPDKVWVYIADLGGERLPLVPYHNKKSVFLGVATMGRSELMAKDTVLWDMRAGEHFQYRQEGINIRIKINGRDSVYRIYLQSPVPLYP